MCSWPSVVFHGGQLFGWNWMEELLPCCLGRTWLKEEWEGVLHLAYWPKEYVKVAQIVSYWERHEGWFLQFWEARELMCDILVQKEEEQLAPL